MDIHVLQGDESGNTHRVAFHIAIPDVNNLAGVPYRTALVQWQGGADEIESQVPFIDPAELVQLKAGELYEVVVDFNTNPQQELQEKQGKLIDLFTNEGHRHLLGLQAILDFWGHSMDAG